MQLAPGPQRPWAQSIIHRHGPWPLCNHVTGTRHPQLLTWAVPEPVPTSVPIPMPVLVLLLVLMPVPGLMLIVMLVLMSVSVLMLMSVSVLMLMPVRELMPPPVPVPVLPPMRCQPGGPEDAAGLRAPGKLRFAPAPGAPGAAAAAPPAAPPAPLRAGGTYPPPRPARRPPIPSGTGPFLPPTPPAPPQPVAASVPGGCIPCVPAVWGGGDIPTHLPPSGSIGHRCPAVCGGTQAGGSQSSAPSGSASQPAKPHISSELESLAAALGKEPHSPRGG